MKVLSFIYLVTKPFRGLLTLSAAGTVATAGCIIYQSILIKNLINAAYTNDTSDLIYNAIAFGILNIVEENAIRRIDMWTEIQYVPALRNTIAQTLFARSCRQPYSFFQNNFAGALTAKVVDCVAVIPTMIDTVLDGWLLGITLVASTIVMIYQINPWIALALAIWTTFFLAVSFLTLSRHHSLTLAARAGVKVVAAHVDAITNMVNVRLFARQREEMRIIEKTHTDYTKLSQNRRWFVLKVNIVQSLSFWIYQAACTIILIALRAKGQITPGDFGLVLSINITLIDQLWRLSEQMRDFSDDWGKVEQALETFYLPLTVQDAPKAHNLQKTDGAISFQHVRFSYHPDKLIFDRLTVDIPSKQKVGLVGYSGSGKSTFVNLLLRLYDLSGGCIRLDGHPIAQATQDSLRQKIAYVPQQPSLFHRTIRENIAYGNPHATMKDIEAAAHKAAAHEFITALPHGYETLVGERGTKLSGGQRQRIALARALLKHAPILILDEATSQLDTITERSIQSALAEFFENSKKKVTKKKRKRPSSLPTAFLPCSIWIVFWCLIMA